MASSDQICGVVGIVFVLVAIIIAIFDTKPPGAMGIG